MLLHTHEIGTTAEHKTLLYMHFNNTLVEDVHQYKCSARIKGMQVTSHP